MMGCFPNIVVPRKGTTALAERKPSRGRGLSGLLVSVEPLALVEFDHAVLCATHASSNILISIA
jgi:hypothetical protein